MSDRSPQPFSTPAGPHEATTEADTASRHADVIRRVADAVAGRLAAIGRCIAAHDDLCVALLLTLVFYYPSLRHAAQDAGYIYTGDVLGYYLPALIKTHAIIGGGSFDALDFSLFDGSSDFFLSPNFFATHPLVALFCLLWPASDLSLATHRFFLVAMFAVHTLAACFFTLRLSRRHFGLDLPAAIFAAVTFAFSMYMVGATGQPPFLFSVSVLPWITCTALDYTRDPSWRRLLLAILPVTLALLGGYPPLGAACVGVSLLFVLLRLLLSDADTVHRRLSDCVLAVLPYAAAAILIAPLLAAMSAFHAETTGSQSGGVHYSAHQLAAAPQAIYAGLSAYWLAPGAVHEFHAIWGVVPLLIVAMFLAGRQRLDPLSQRIVVALAAVYCVSLLAIYGDFSVVADMVYYFVPKIGRMHIYQRFLLLTQLAFAIMLAVMVQALARGPIPRARTALAALFALTMASGIVTARFPAVAETIGISQHFTVELLCGCFLAAAMLTPHRVVLPVAAAILACLPAFDRMYDRSLYGNTLAAARTRQPLALDDGLKHRIAAFFAADTTKDRVKYVDITPMWDATGIETFPKVFPYYVLDDVSLTSFGGFTFYLSARADFMQHAPVEGEAVAVQPEWDLVEESGVDFVVARDEDVASPTLRKRLGIGDASGGLALPGGARIHRLRFRGDGAAGRRSAETDNGWFRVLPAAAATGTERINLAFGRPARQSSTADGPADRAVDGDTHGDHARGSVTHTGSDAHAWLDIDLGEPQPIGTVRLWGRTDCCQDRLSDYWVLISETPFPDDATVADLRERPGVHAFPGMKPAPSATIHAGATVGRYVRVQLGGGANPLGTFLSLAECEVFAPDVTAASSTAPPRIVAFESNEANWFSMVVDAPEPALAQYLLWPNPRSTFYVDGQPVAPTRLNGLAAIPVPAGRHTIEMRYRHWPLRLFWLVYAAYVLTLAVAILPSWSARAIASLVDALYGSPPPPAVPVHLAGVAVASAPHLDPPLSGPHGLSAP